MLFLADTFVTPETLGVGAPVVEVLPLTYFSRAVRGATFTGEPTATALVFLAGFAVVLFAAGAYLLPWQD
jgi:ABC-2 type transport system permease protein